MTSKVIVVSAVAVGALCTRTYVAQYGASIAENSVIASNAPVAMAHLDHSPRHGGLVLMNGETHFEVVLDRAGQYNVYFSDAVRVPLPASTTSQVDIRVTQAGYLPETIRLQIDEAGTRWVGRGTPIEDRNAIVRITYDAGEKPYWIDVPVSAWSLPDLNRRSANRRSQKAAAAMTRFVAQMTADSMSAGVSSGS
jgi:hypothetical protein